MLSKVAIAVCGLGILAVLAASDARPYDAHAGAPAPAPQVMAAITEHAATAPPAANAGPQNAQGTAAASADAEPKNWVLVAAGVYLIGTVLRRRARSTTI